MGFCRGISPPRRRAGFRPAGRVSFPRGKGTKRRWGTPQRRTSFAMSACPQTPALRGRQLGRMVRYRKGAGGSVERPPLVFRWTRYLRVSKAGTPLVESAFVAAGLKLCGGKRRIRESLRFSRRARCPHRAVPGRPGVPPLRRPRKPLFFRRGRTLAGPPMTKDFQYTAGGANPYPLCLAALDISP